MQFSLWLLDTTFIAFLKMFNQLFYCALFSNKIQIYIPIKNK